MPTDKNKYKFKEGQRVVYPLQGVGKIVSIETRKFKSRRIEYYIIRLDASEMTIMVPVNKSKDMGIRRLVFKREAESLFDNIKDDPNAPSSSDWKLRYQYCLEQIRDGKISDIASILRILYIRSKTKDLPIMERKLYDSSLQALILELSIVLKRSEDELKKQLIEAFEKPLPDSEE